jgi:hypothetical protein
MVEQARPAPQGGRAPPGRAGDELGKVEKVEKVDEPGGAASLMAARSGRHTGGSADAYWRRRRRIMASLVSHEGDAGIPRCRPVRRGMQGGGRGGPSHEGKHRCGPGGAPEPPRQDLLNHGLTLSRMVEQARLSATGSRQGESQDFGSRVPTDSSRLSSTPRHSPLCHDRIAILLSSVKDLDLQSRHRRCDSSPYILY